MSLFRRFSLCLAALVSLSAAAQDLAKYGSTFIGNQGLTVILAPTTDGNGALVQVKGVNHSIDGVVLLTEKVPEGARVFYRAQIDGRARGVLYTEEPYGQTRAFALLPGARDAIVLSDDSATKPLDVAALRAEYQLQKQAGVQDKLARFDRPGAVARQQQEQAEVDAAASRVCGAPVKTSVIWDALSDDQLQRLNIPSFCGSVAKAMRSLCDSDASFKPVVAQYAQIECRFGERLRLRSEAGKLLFTTEEAAANQSEFALQYLRNQ